MLNVSARLFFVGAICALVVVMVGCAGVSTISSNHPPTLALSPASPSVSLGGKIQFSVSGSGTTNTAMIWAVNGVQSGNAAYGTISSTGLYAAPATAPAGSVVVTATSSTDSAESASATVALKASTTSIAVSISPSSSTAQVSASRQFTATVSGTSNTAVTWFVNGVQSGSSTYGTITSAGLYTAPATVPSGGVSTVTAKSAADSTKSASATVTVNSATSHVTVAITPASVSVSAGATQQFDATVSGTTNTGVAWLVNNVPNGSSAYGTISSTGLYSAPSCAATSTVTVTAQSTYDTNASANSTVNIPGTSNSSNRYVATHGSDSNDGSACHPWATIQHADSLAKAGWTIHIAAGTYDVGSGLITHASGTSSSRVVYIGEGYDKSTLTWPVHLVGSGTAVWNTAGQYEDIIGFDMTSTDPNATWGIHGQAAYDRYIDNYIHDIYSDSPGAAVMIGGGADHQEVIGNVIAHVGHTMGGSTDNQGIYVQENYTNVINNILYDCHKVCIQIWSGAAAGKPQYNVVSGNTEFGSYRGFDIGAAGPAFADHNIVTNNIFYSNRDLGMYTTSGAQAYVGTHNTIAFNNSSLNPTGDYYNLTYTSPIDGDPLFVNYQPNGGGSYKLRSNSPCVDTATTTGAPAYDFLNDSRPSTSEDCGAYEHQP